MAKNESSTTLSSSILALSEHASGEFAASLVFYASLTMLVYDTLITLDEEIIYIWNSKWSPIKCVFLLVRYLSLSIQIFSAIAAGSPSALICLISTWFSGVGGLLVEATADIFLVYRVYAFCGGGKYLRIFFIVYYIAWEATTITLGAIFLPLYVNVVDPVPQLLTVIGSCIPIVYPRAIAIIWISMLSFQSILFTCLFLKISHTQYEAWKLGLQSSPLYAVFVRDGVWAYLLIAVGLVLCVISVYKAQNFGDSFIIWLITITNICCCRFILDLRSTAHQAVSDVSLQLELELTDASLP